MIMEETQTAPKKPIFMKKERSFFILRLTSFTNSKRAIQLAENLSKWQ